ncbi:TOM1-like protein 2 isoform X2 [Notolabrus celidotus]|uniref:TOM1-like protein 2 isoform X2 n=1 Tax=Notolabrus celidotus TaxID=1203425 RepID=UPI00148F7B3D|nr:TOM1-like protein 2 isoform X2 [Notolabrus celidotus]
MEFLLGNPFSTPVGHCIERATDGSLQSEDWTLNMEICDIINETEDGPKDAIRAVKKRLNGNRNYREVMLALTVLETCVKNCGHRFHALVTSRDFVDGVLVKIISPKNNPPTIVQDKVLALIQAWADAFRSSPDLTGVVQIYEELKRKGIEFPMSELETLSPIHTPQRVGGINPSSLNAATAPEGDSALHKYSTTTQPTPQALPPAYTTPQVPNIHASGSINPTPEQICRLRSELDIVRGNTKVMSEMLTEMVPGQEDASDYELLQELNRTCRAMQQRIVELISCVSNEAVTEELLHVNDDLNNIFLRYDRYERFRSGRSSAQSVNNGVLSEATEDNLIDLGPGSPAVVSNMQNAAPSSLPPAITAPAGRPSSPATLASRLAGLDVGADSVSSTLSSLPSCKPPPAQDDFDVFAQTRTGSLPEPSKTSTTEDSNATSSLPPTLTVQQPTAGARVGSQSSVMDDIEEWLCTDVKGDEGEEGVTSEEFDKFLEERAKAAEMAPSLPSPPSGEPGAVQGTPSRKKPDRPEDALLAM